MTRNVTAPVRQRLEGAPDTLHEAVQVLSSFLVPVIRALSQDQPFDRHWPPGGLWT